MEGFTALHALSVVPDKMKSLWLLPILLICCCGGNCSTPSPGNITDEFREICASYQAPGFEERLAHLIPIGTHADAIQDLLAIADRQTPSRGKRVYVFDYATNAFSEQGLVVSISVDDQDEQVTDIQSAVAAN